MTPEGRVKALVKRRLDCHGWQSQGLYLFMPVQNGMGAPSLDFLGCYKGLFFAIETKVAGRELTPRQKVTAQKIASTGGLVFAVRDDQDVTEMITALVQWDEMHSYDEYGRQRPLAGVIFDKLWKDANARQGIPGAQSAHSP